MPKGDVTYHEDAVRYNQEIAQFAEDLALTIRDEEVQKWSRAVAKQHRFHEGRHQKALNKARSREQEQSDSKLDPGPVVDDILPVGTDLDMSEIDTQSIQEAQAEFAQSQEAADVETGGEAILETGVIDPDSVMDPNFGAEEKAETDLCEGGFPRSMPVSYPTGQCTSDSCTGGHPVTEEKENNSA